MLIDWIILIVLTLVIFLYAYIQYTAPNLDDYIKRHSKSLNWINVTRIFNEADNGDLLFFGGNTCGERTCKWVSNSPFTHVGVLVKEDGVLYILDADLGQKIKEGPRIALLRTKMIKYGGYPYVMWRRYRGPTINTLDLMKSCVKHLTKEFDDTMLSYYGSVKGAVSDAIYYTFKDHNKVFCSEMTAMVLSEVGILSLQNRRPSYYLPGTFTLPDIPGIEKGVYGPRYYARIRY